MGVVGTSLGQCVGPRTVVWPHAATCPRLLSPRGFSEGCLRAWDPALGRAQGLPSCSFALNPTPCLVLSLTWKLVLPARLPCVGLLRSTWAQKTLGQLRGRFGGVCSECPSSHPWAPGSLRGSWSPWELPPKSLCGPCSAAPHCSAQREPCGHTNTHLAEVRAWLPASSQAPREGCLAHQGL